MHSRVEIKIKWAAWLVFAGLVCILLSFSKIHPLAFVVFLTLACPLTIAGMIFFFVALLQRDQAIQSGPEPPV
jgi:hypothetical protein